MDCLYADGGIVGARNPSSIGGVYAWCLVRDDEIIQRDSGLFTPADVGMAGVENNLAEFVAMLLAFEAMSPGWFGNVHTDNKNTIGRFFWGWAVAAVPNSLVQRMQEAKSRLNVSAMTPVLLDGHPTKQQLVVGRGKRGNPVSKYNVWCDEECNRIKG